MTKLDKETRSSIKDYIIDVYQRIGRDMAFNTISENLNDYVDLREYVGVLNVKELKECYLAQRAMNRKLGLLSPELFDFYYSRIANVNKRIVSPEQQEFYDFFSHCIEFDIRNQEIMEYVKDGNEYAKSGLEDLYKEIRAFYKQYPYSKFKEKLRDIINPGIIKIMESTYDFEVNVEDKFQKSQKPVIYAVNHTNSHDVPVVCKAIKNHVYIIAGDEVRNDINGLMFNLNGVDWVNRGDADSRFISKEQAIRHIVNGYNYLIFPEGTWNRTENLLMLPLNWGIIEMAQKSGAPIVPVITDYRDGYCTVKIGEPIEISIFDDKKEAIDKLRDTMATMRYTEWDKYPITKREDVSREKFMEEGPGKDLRDYPKLDPEFEDSIIFWPYIRPCVAYEHLNDIEVTPNNAWLFNKRFTGADVSGEEIIERKEASSNDVNLTRKLQKK